jgi:hypothetical protein
MWFGEWKFCLNFMFGGLTSRWGKKDCWGEEETSGHSGMDSLGLLAG